MAQKPVTFRKVTFSPMTCLQPQHHPLAHPHTLPSHHPLSPSARRWLPLLCAAVVATAALPAAVPAAWAEDGWSGSAELGFSNTSGNSEDRTLNARFDLDYTQAQWRHNLFGDTYRAESGNLRSAARTALGYKPSYFLSDVDYVFASLRYDKDEFADIRQRWSQVVGYGRQLIKTGRTLLEAEAGVGARQTRYVLNPNNLQRNEGLLYGGLRFEHRLSDSASLLQTLRVDYGKSNTALESISGLQLKVTEAVSAKITHTIRRNSDIVGALGERTDQITGVNLVYSF